LFLMQTARWIPGSAARPRDNGDGQPHSRHSGAMQSIEPQESIQPQMTGACIRGVRPRGNEGLTPRPEFSIARKALRRKPAGLGAVAEERFNDQQLVAAPPLVRSPRVPSPTKR
jgi:hypothetical protein